MTSDIGKPRVGVLRWAARTAISLVGTDLGIRAFGRVRATIGPAVADIRLIPGSAGGTVVRVPPVGAARIASHRGTLGLQATLVGVDQAAAKGLIADLDNDPSPQKALVKSALGDAKLAGKRLVLKGAVGGVAGAGLLNLVLLRRPGNLLGSSVVATAAMAAAGAVAAKTLKSDSWKDPNLSGLLSEAPKMLGQVQDIPKQFGRYRSQVGEIVASVTGVLRALTGLPAGPPADAIRVVHMSDVHNNPMAFEVAAALVAQYDAHAVIDTGDICDWGTPAEAKLMEPIRTLPVPYVYIKGNHDSDKTAALLDKYSNVVVCNSATPVVVADLRIVGLADPRFTPDKTSGGDQMSKNEMADAGTAYAARIRELDATAGRPVDLALLHDPAMAKPLAGVVPLVLCGHTHKRRYDQVEGTLFLIEGTSGGAGLRGVRNDPPDPLAFSVLHFDRSTHDLHTVDAFTIGGMGQTEVSLVRRTATDLVAPPAS